MRPARVSGLGAHAQDSPNRSRKSLMVTGLRVAVEAFSISGTMVNIEAPLVVDMHSNEGHLFCERTLLELIQERNSKAIREIDSIPEGQLLEMNVEEFGAALVEQYWMEPIRLDMEAAGTERDEARIDVRNDPFRMISDRSKPVYAKGLRVTLVIPFTGDPAIFGCVPENYSTRSPLGTVKGSEIRMCLEGLDLDPKEARAQFDQNINLIQQYLGWGQAQVNRFNLALSGLVQGRLNQRKEKLLQDDKLVEAIGFRLRPRSNSPQTYAVPVHRKKVPISQPSPVGKPHPGEPFLESRAYESILETIASMARVKELNPKAFAAMGEEALRFMLLVPLNIHYEGQATGETFNWEGKTDIIIKVGGRNVFIAECLVWGGPQYFREKIDQLLDYISWRDTKTAIIVFNRNQNTSKVLEQIPGLVAAHPNFLRIVTDYRNETGFRFILHHRDDKKRELTLTALVFDVPA